MSRSDLAFSSRQSGASLVSALLLVAVMASMAMMLAGELRVAMRRSVNMEGRDQAYWYAVGAREYAGGLIATAMREPARALRPDADWLRSAREFPIERGALSGRISDGNNCFNLNALVVADGQGGLIADPVQRRRFEHLMSALGVPGAEAGRIAAEASDWIDSDNRPLAGGGEDAVYADRSTPYRTGNTLMAEREEILALASMTPAIYQRLAPHVCARPVAAPLPLNINTLTTDDWPLLFAVLDGELGRVAVEGLLLGRPATGFASAAEFWTLETVAALAPDVTLRETVGIETRYFDVAVNVRHDGQSYRLDAVYEWRGGTTLHRLTQRYGYAE
ncbi:type II secretion system minor pseudopilin GspK [Maricaulis sp.]|uniref:type II secretion system minor pseudopilin GspK n=1 Tax=Maricaulis sp. TaxID=1486257 RepID=UPI0025BC12B8|nr:type II secretion system minor pseudopilin GspK [Maricaulis sp.]